MLQKVVGSMQTERENQPGILTKGRLMALVLGFCTHFLDATQLPGGAPLPTSHTFLGPFSGASTPGGFQVSPWPPI